MTDPLTGQAYPAVIAGITSTAVVLVSRRGRTLHVPHRSFGMTWRFLHEALPHDCHRADCPVPAVVQIQIEGGWNWVCGNHIPSGTQGILLPFDTPTNRVANGALEICPACRAARNVPGSGTIAIEGAEGVASIERCGRCNREWILLLAPGRSDDGQILATRLIEFADTMGARVANLRIHAGTTIYRAIRRASGRTTVRSGSTTQEVTRLAGIDLVHDNQFGSNTLVLIGDPMRRPVSRIGTPGEVYVVSEPESVGRMPTRQEIPILPARGSCWTAADGTVVQIIRVSETTEPRVAFSPGPDGQSQGELPVREFLGRYEVGGIRPVRVPPAQEQVPILQGAELRDPEPRAGETWWHKKTTEAAFLTSVHVDENAVKVVSFRSGAEPAQTIPLVDFLANYDYHPVEPPCQAGEEWINPDNEVVRIREVLMERREVLVTTASHTVKHIAFPVFLSKFEKLERRSVYERILENDFE